MSLGLDAQDEKLKQTLAAIDKMEKNWQDTIQGFSQNIEQMATLFAMNALVEGLPVPDESTFNIPHDDVTNDPQTAHESKCSDITSKSSEWNIGDTIQYKYNKSSDKCAPCDNWYEGEGVIVANEQSMVKVKLSYGCITFKLENLQLHTTATAITASSSSSTTDEQLPRRFFVYGTLRDDDDSNACWTKSFVKDCIGQDALLYGFKLYKLSQANYPFALKTNSNDCVVGRLLYWNEDREFFVEKLQIADGIEGYHEADSEHNLYQREVVDVVIAGTKETEKAIVYYRTNASKLMQNAIAIPYGDWLKRNHVASCTQLVNTNTWIDNP
eukprot:584087_1